MKIALFLGDIYQTYQTIVTNAMNRYAKEHDISLAIFANFARLGNNIFHVAGEKSIIHLPDLSCFDGIVVAGDTFKIFGMQNELMRRIRKEATCPVVSLREMENDYVSVVNSDKKAMYEMTNHFIFHHKFTDICFVTGRMEMLDAQERLSGYRQAMQEADIPVSDTMIFYGDYWRLKGPDIIDYFMQWRQSYPQAIVCSNDYMAFSVCEELKRRGVNVPEEVCVSGMDDLGEARTTEPQLTSVEVPYADMATKAIDVLYRMIKGEQIENNKILVEDKLHFRSSCRCPDDEVLDGSSIRTEFVRFRYMTKECFYMVSDYSSALNENECMEMTGRMAKSLNLKNYYVCMNEPEARDEDGNIITRRNPFLETMHLRHHLDRHGRPIVSDIPFDKKNLLPNEMLKEIENETYFVVPLHYRKDVFGYVIYVLRDDVPCMLDERHEFLCINTAMSLNMINTYEELLSMRDIRSLYLKDPLTNIYNRRGFEYELTDIHRKYGKKNIDVALASIDMDGLKYINDNFGHAAGDDSICAVAKCISDSLVGKEFCARMGGDEFITVLYNDYDGRLDDFRTKLSNLLEDVNRQIQDDYVVDVSVGICPVKTHDTIIDSIQNADVLMYKEKRSKVNKQGR
ncbi:MAG: GGDEF domain-containing protein [Eubacteriales bacterium]|nr:GGDEF domain-containing protein [Eubacteriales bacterium]